jgi:transposase
MWRITVIVVGVDAHMQTHTAAALDAVTARCLAEQTAAAREPGFVELLAWARGLDAERVWAIEDCRNLSGGLERFLLGCGERVLRVPPKTMADRRRSAREFGKSDRIDAIAVARAALREERLQPARLPGPEQKIKLLADHREHQVCEATRHQRRLRWLLHEIDPDLQPNGRSLKIASVLERLARQLARREQTLEVRLCRELVRDIRALTRRCEALETELAPMVKAQAASLLAIPGVAVLTAAKLISEIGPPDRFDNDAQLASYGGVAPLDASSGRRQRHRLNRTGNRQLNCALHRIAATQARVYAPAREYLARRIAEGKTTKEAMRALKRFIARRIFRVLTAPKSRTFRPTPGAKPLHCLT